MTYLKSANQRIIHLVLKQLTPLVVDARPAPHILIIAVVLRALQDAGRDTPHHDAEDEEADSEDGIVHGRFLRSSVAASPVCVEDHQAKSERDTSGHEDDILRP